MTDQDFSMAIALLQDARHTTSENHRAYNLERVRKLIAPR